jgi:hypothetical protein
MSTEVRVEVTISRPPAEVAAFIFDPKNDAAWTKNVIAARPFAEGRLRAGSKVERTVKFLGRKFSYQYEVVAAEGDNFVEMTVDEPFPMQIRYELKDASQGTVASIHARGNAGGFYKLAAPLLNGMVHRSIKKDLQTLRACLEAKR